MSTVVSRKLNRDGSTLSGPVPGTRVVVLILELTGTLRSTLASADPLADRSEDAKCSYTCDFFHYGVLLAPLPHKVRL